jgi:hypothetical protein
MPFPIKKFFSLIKKAKQFDSKDIKITKIGLKFTQNSLDPVHDLGHLYRMMGSYFQFKKSNENPKLNISDRVMVHSIVWHDVWKTLRRQSFKGVKLISDEIYEGIGSMRIFARYAKKLHLDAPLIKKVKYAIRKHATISILPRSTRESRLLNDLDELDFWNVKRLKLGIQNYRYRYLAAQKYFKYRLKKAFYYPWTQTKFERKIRELEKYLG